MTASPSRSRSQHHFRCHLSVPNVWKSFIRSETLAVDSPFCVAQFRWHVILQAVSVFSLAIGLARLLLVSAHLPSFEFAIRGLDIATRHPSISIDFSSLSHSFNLRVSISSPR